MNDCIVLGIDIGGSHLTAALVNEQKQSMIRESYTRVRVNSQGSSDEILSTWTSVIQTIFSQYNITEMRVGVAMPGPFDYEKGISLITGLDKYESLYSVNVKQYLASHLQMPSSFILMMNDAACFLRGEVYSGAARGYDHAIGITLGTGTGTAIHHNGITEDANLGPSPYRQSIADEYFSTRWFIRRYRELSGNIVKDVKELSDLYRTDSYVREVFYEFISNLSDFLAQFARKENPDVIVMGGNISQCSDLFLPELIHALVSAGISMPVVKAQLGEEAAILGAASLFKNH